MYHLVGIEDVDYFSEKIKKQVKGKRLHLLCPPNTKSTTVQGSKVETRYIGKEELLMGVEVGDKIDFLYNKYGRVERIDLCE